MAARAPRPRAPKAPPTPVDLAALTAEPFTPVAPLDARPVAQVMWTFPWFVSDALPAALGARVRAAVEGSTTVDDARGSNAVVPDGDLDAWCAQWRVDAEVMTASRFAREALLDATADDRAAALRAALAGRGWIAWQRVCFVIGAAPASERAPLLDLAERALSAWPDWDRVASWRMLDDETRGHPETLRRLARKVSGGAVDAASVERGRFDAVTCLATRDLVGLEAHQGRLAHLTELSVMGERAAHDVVARCVGLSSLARVSLSCPYDARPLPLDLSALLRAPHLAGLRALGLDGYALTPDGVRALARGPRRVEHLRLESASLAGAGAGEALADVIARHGPRSLELARNPLGPPGVSALLATSGLDDLRALDLSSVGAGDAAALAVARAPSLTSLRWLRLDGGGLGDAAALALSRAEHLGRLETLSIHGDGLRDAGVASLLSAPALRSLRRLAVYGRGATWSGVLKRLAGGDPPPLEDLDVVAAQSLKTPGAWSRATFLRGVRRLKLGGLQGHEYGPLLGCGHLSALELLVLGACTARRDEALAAMLRAPPLPSLRVLSLRGWSFTATEAEALARSPLVRGLAGVDVRPGARGDEAPRALLAAGVPAVSTGSYPEFFMSPLRHWDHAFRDDVCEGP